MLSTPKQPQTYFDPQNGSIFEMLWADCFVPIGCDFMKALFGGFLNFHTDMFIGRTNLKEVN